MSRLRTIAADEVRPEAIQWLTPGIPAIGLTLLVGDPGLGKSMYTVGLAAQASRGELDPGRPFAFMVTGEDSLAAVAVPRLEAAAAQLPGVAFLEPDEFGDAPLTLPDDAAELEAKIAQFNPCLVVIDPLSAFLSSYVNSWRDQSVRQALRPLHVIAEAHRCAVVVVAHLNKAVGADPLHRTGGSVGIPAAARSALLLARDPDDPDGEEGRRRVLAHFKSNYGELVPSRRFDIEPATLDRDEEISTALLREVGESSHGAHALLAQPQGNERTERDDAIDFLRTELADGPRPAKEIRSAAREAGIHDRTLDRAKAELRVTSKKAGLSAGWTWALSEGRHLYMSDVAVFDEQAENAPSKDTPGSEERHSSDMAPFAANGHRADAEIERLIAVAEDAQREASELGVEEWEE